MLGHYCRGPGGYKCQCCRDPDTTRWRKKVERREVLVEIEDEAPPPVFFDEHDLAVIGMYEDEGECQHGCNGSPSCSERCTFVCHEDG